MNHAETLAAARKTVGALWKLPRKPEIHEAARAEVERAAATLTRLGAPASDIIALRVYLNDTIAAVVAGRKRAVPPAPNAEFVRACKAARAAIKAARASIEHAMHVAPNTPEAAAEMRNLHRAMKSGRDE